MIVGLVGFIGNGKGTVGDILANEYGFKRESFAKSVKDALCPIFGWERDMLEGDTPESRDFREKPDEYWSEVMGKPFTPRYALQLMGTEAGRNVFHPNIWVYSLERRISAEPLYNYVITDVRFPNEMAMIRRLGGLIVYVKRGAKPLWWDSASNINTYFKGVQTMPDFPGIHYSEFAWIGYPLDATINNDGTFQELKENIAYTVDKLLQT
jgi:hypothetical protein